MTVTWQIEHLCTNDCACGWRVRFDTTNEDEAQERYAKVTTDFPKSRYRLRRIETTRTEETLQDSHVLSLETTPEQVERRMTQMLTPFAQETDECYCDESDVYDGYAECPVHPAGGPRH